MILYRYVPDAMQSTVNNIFRLPLNLLVAAGNIYCRAMLSTAINILTIYSHAATTYSLRVAAGTLLGPHPRICDCAY